MELLRRHSYPGNVRELEHILIRASFQGTGDEIRPEDFPAALLSGISGVDATAIASGSSGAEALYERIVHGSESFWEVVQGPYLRREVSRETARELIARALREAGGSYRDLARLFRMEGEYRRLLDFCARHKLGPTE